jgi:hypothetical protein
MQRKTVRSDYCVCLEPGDTCGGWASCLQFGADLADSGYSDAAKRVRALER